MSYKKAGARELVIILDEYLHHQSYDNFGVKYYTWMVYIQVTFSQNAHLTRRPAAHRSLPPQQLDPKGDPKGLLAGTKMLRVLLISMLITGTGAQLEKRPQS